MKNINRILKNRVKPVLPRALLARMAGLALLATAGITNAAILAYEPFDYPLGAINDGTLTTASGTPTAISGGGFSGTWFAGGVGTTIVGGLTYPGLQTTNNALQWSTSVPYQGENLAAPIFPSTTPTVYVSFLYNAPSYTANKSGFALDNGAASNQGYYMGMTAPGVFGVATVDNGSGTVLGTASETISYNTTYFIVVQFNKDAAGTYYKSGSIWINPTPGASEPAASGTFTGTYTLMNKIADFLTALGGSAVKTDEIRLGTTWADVTPSNGLSGPATPTGLQVDSEGTNSVSLSWTASAGGPISYNVKRAATSNGTYSVVGTTTAPTVTFTNTLTGGSTFYYAVSAVNVGGESADSAFVSATPILGVPDAPSDLAATAGDNQVALSWTAPAIGEPTSYNVLRSATSGSGYSAITTPGAQTTTSYTDTTAGNGTNYYYVVTAENAAGASTNSTEVSATPAAYSGAYEPFDYPGEDNLLDGTTSTGDGFGTWNNGVAGWVLAGLSYPDLPTAHNAMRTPAGRQSVSMDVPLSSETKWISYLWSHSAGDPGANHNGVYFLNGGTGLYFGVGYAGTATEGKFGLASINTVGTTVDNSPALLTNTTNAYPYGGTKLIVLKIDFNTSGNNDTITVYVNPTANQSTPGVDAAAVYSAFDVGTISGIGMQVAGSGDFITDEFRIAESYPAVVDAVVNPPDAPTGLMATGGSNTVALSWTAAAGGGQPTDYNVKRSTHSGGPYAIIGSTTVPTVTYNDSVLGGTTNYYVVSAANGIGESSNSVEVAVLPILAPPVAVAGLMVVPGDSQVALSWTASAFATGYEIKRATEIGGPYVSLGTTSLTTFDDFGVANSVTYYYIVTAIGAGGTSPENEPEEAIPVGPVPLVLSIDQGVGISWFASNSVTYLVQWASEDLGTNTVWNTLGESISGDGTTNTVFDPAGPPHNLYQVLSIE